MFALLLRRALLGLPLVLTCGADAQMILSARVDKQSGQNSGTVLARMGSGERRIATAAMNAWVAMNGAGVLFTERSTKAGLEKSGQALKLYDARSEITRTLADEEYPIVDVMQDMLPNTRWMFVVTSLSDGGVPAVSVVNPERGMVKRYRSSAPDTIQQDILILNHYDEQDVAKLGGKYRDAKPTRTERVPLVELAEKTTIAGVYSASMKSGQDFTLELRPGGRARISKPGSTGQLRSEDARWMDKDGMLTITFLPRYGRSAAKPVHWTIEGEELIPVEWSNEEWGTSGLPRLTKSAEVREPHRGCSWSRWSDLRLGVALLTENCTESGARSLTAAGNTLRAVSSGGAVATSPVVLEVFRKPANQPLATALQAQILSKLPANVRSTCMVEPASAKSRGQGTEAWQITSVSGARCGDYDGSLAYVEYHPGQSRETFLVVRPGTDPIFDEQSIRILR